MDSCHLFNFLFDTKKARSELTKCFSAFRDKVAKEATMGASGSRNGAKRNQSNNHIVSGSSCSTPSSPLKQLRAKISNNFSSSNTILASTSSKSSDECPHQHNDNKQDATSLISETLISQQLEKLEQQKHLEDSNNNDESFFNDLSNARKYDQLDCMASSASPDPSHEVEHLSKQDDRDSQQICCSQQEHSGTYRANLVQSVSFDRDGGIIIRDPAPATQQMSRQSLAATSGVCLESRQLRNHDHDQSSSAEISLDLTTLQSLTLTSTDREAECLVSEDSQPENSSSVKRVILYAGNEQLSDDERPARNVCSTAEVFNIVNTNYKYDSDMTLDYGRDEHDNEGQNKEGGWRRPEHHEGDALHGPRSARTSFRERGRSSSLVRTLVQSFEDRTSPNQSLDFPESPRSSFKVNSWSSNNKRPSNVSDHSNDDTDSDATTPTATSNPKPFSLVRPLPPKAPPKSRRAKCLTMQLNLEKPSKIDKLFSTNEFLRRFFAFLEPLDRCRAAQVNSQWRTIIYAIPSLWSDLTLVIDYCQLRRDLVLDCIISTLSSAKLASNSKHQRYHINNNCQHHQGNNVPLLNVSSNAKLVNADHSLYEVASCSTATTTTTNSNDLTTVSSSRESSPSLSELDLDDVWRIQELCNRLANRPALQHQAPADQATPTPTANTTNNNNHFTSQSCSIPSQISSTLSSSSLSSLLSPPTLADGSLRMEVARERLYDSIRRRQFDSICLAGANNDDLEEFLAKLGKEALNRVQYLKLRNTIVTDKGLTHFLGHFYHVQDLELILCNCISNRIELSSLKQLRCLVVQDCINITDDFADYLVPVGHQLESLNIHAYHISDYFPEHLGDECEMSRLKVLKFPFCRELGDRTLISVAKYFKSLETLDLSGTNISDKGVEFLANQRPPLELRSLDLGWCAGITDTSIDFLTQHLSETLTELVLDRNIHITDWAMEQLVEMRRLRDLHLRWCHRITDYGIEQLVLIDSLRCLSIAGLQQITSRSLLRLPQTNLLVLELANCQAVNSRLISLLADKMPNCNITY